MTQQREHRLVSYTILLECYINIMCVSLCVCVWIYNINCKLYTQRGTPFEIHLCACVCVFDIEWTQHCAPTSIVCKQRGSYNCARESENIEAPCCRHRRSCRLYAMCGKTMWQINRCAFMVHINCVLLGLVVFVFVVLACLLWLALKVRIVHNNPV